MLAVSHVSVASKLFVVNEIHEVYFLLHSGLCFGQGPYTWSYFLREIPVEDNEIDSHWSELSEMKCREMSRSNA